MGSITAEDLMELRRNPEALEREIARYTQIRDEAESKLRAVVDEVTAREYLERADKERRAAEGALEQANGQAAGVMKLASDRAEALVGEAVASASRVLSEANVIARETTENARRELETATAEKEKAEALNVKMQRETERAEASSEACNNAKLVYEEETRAIAAIRQRLAALIGEMREVVGDAG